MTAPAVPLFDLIVSEDDLAAVESVLRSGRLGEGEQVRAFEAAFARHLGCEYAVAVANCTAALHLAYLTLGVGPGDEVIVPSITFAASATAVIYCGGTPVFADVLSVHDLGVSVESVEHHISDHTVAICAVHYAGYPAAIEELRLLCDARGIALVEDAAHAPSADCNGHKLGTFGDAGCFSFFSNKVLAVGEGGLLATNDPAIAAGARALREAPFNYRFDEARAALGLSRLGRLEEDIATRRALTLRYRQLLAGVDGVIVPYSDDEVAHSSCYVMPLVLEDPERQSSVRAHLREKHGVQTSLLYPAVHEFSAYIERYGRPSLPVSERIARSQVTVPLFGHMTHEQQDRVVDGLREALAA